MKFYTVPFLIICALLSFSQPRGIQEFRTQTPNGMVVISSPSMGFGLIVGEKSGKLFIVCPSHIIHPDISKEIDVKKIKIQSTTKVTTYFRDIHVIKYFPPDSLDFTLLSVTKPSSSFQWKGDYESTPSLESKSCSYFGRRGIFDLATEVRLNLVTDTIVDFWPVTGAVETGSSGGVLVNNKGVIGIIFGSSGADASALNIKLIRKIVTGINKDYYGLIPSSIANMVLMRSIKNFKVGVRAEAKDRSFYKDDKEVKIGQIDSFYIAKTEVSRGDYEEYLKSNRSLVSIPEWYKDSNDNDNDPLHSGIPLQYKLVYNNKIFGEVFNLPVVGVSWMDAARYCNWLAEKEGFEKVYTFRPGGVVDIDLAKNGYRLPTEIEWEYAAKVEGKLYSLAKDQPIPIENHFNHCDLSCEDDSKEKTLRNDGYPFLAPVNAYKPNEFGIYNMSGNIREWCNNWYNEDINNYQYPKSNPKKAIRGGSFATPAIMCRVTNRYAAPIDYRSFDLGFRICRNIN